MRKLSQCHLQISNQCLSLIAFNFNQHWIYYGGSNLITNFIAPYKVLCICLIYHKASIKLNILKNCWNRQYNDGTSDCRHVLLPPASLSDSSQTMLTIAS